VRISNVFWIGTQDELKVAQKKDPPDPNNAELKSIALQGLADDAAVARRNASPICWRDAIGSKAPVVEKGALPDSLSSWIVYFARPGGLYLPWYVTAKPERCQSRKTAALAAAQTDATWFADHLREIKGRIGQGSTPFTLKAKWRKRWPRETAVVVVWIPRPDGRRSAERLGGGAG